MITTDEWFLQLRFNTNKVNKDQITSDEVFEKLQSQIKNMTRLDEKT